MRGLGLALLVLTLSGCALFTKPADEIRFDRGELAVSYADMKAAYVLLAQSVTAACTSGKLSPAACADAAKIHDRMGLLDAAVRKAIRNPKAEVDWEAVGEAVRLIAGLALKAL